MRLRRGTYPTLALGLLAAVGLYAGAAGTAVQQPWGQDGCHLDWCQPKPLQPYDSLDDQLQAAADVAKLGAGRGCRRPADWTPGVLPAAMILGTEQYGGTVTVTPWTYPAPDGMWVLALCAR